MDCSALTRVRKIKPVPATKKVGFFWLPRRGAIGLVTHRRNVLLKLLKVKSLPEATQSPCDQAHPLVFVVGREIYESPDLLLQRVPLAFPHEECALQGPSTSLGLEPRELFT